MLLFLSMSISSLIFLIFSLLSKKLTFSKEKFSIFECGFDPFSSSRNPFSLRFFKIALIFLIFDIEIAYFVCIPNFYNFSCEFFLNTSIIIILMLLGLLFEWHQNSLEWNKLMNN